MALIKIRETSPQKLEANRRNAQLSTGPRTERGKKWSRGNALKHGILSSALVITQDGLEDAAEYKAMLSRLRQDLKPAGELEEMMVEKIAVSWWRLQRALRFEVQAIRWQLTQCEFTRAGLIGDQKLLDLLAIMQAGEAQAHTEMIPEHLRGIEVERRRELALDQWRDKIYDDEMHVYFERMVRDRLRHYLGEAEIERFDAAQEAQQASARERGSRRTDSFNKETFSLPTDEDLNRILRYDAANNRQLYQAINQLERMQRARKGEQVPAPVNVQVSSDG